MTNLQAESLFQVLAMQCKEDRQENGMRPVRIVMMHEPEMDVGVIKYSAEGSSLVILVNFGE